MMIHANRKGGLLLALFFWTNVACIHALSFAFPPVSTTTKETLFASHLRSKARNKDSMTLTYLEINSWLLTMSGVTILVDPLLEGPLDFGIPKLYKGQKRVLPASGTTESLPPIDCVLITQGLDDHAHVKTLQKLHSLDPNLPIVASPSAKGALKACGFYDRRSKGTIRFLKHGEETRILPRSPLIANKAASISVRATKGALVGPPWQTRENGYILRGNDENNSPSLYIEPHVEFNRKELRELGPVDVVISPISGQSLPAFELVHGPKDTLRLLETLRPKYLLPMQNGDIDTEGPVSRFVSEVGSPQEFEKRLSASQLETELVKVAPGKDIVLSS